MIRKEIKRGKEIKFDDGVEKGGKRGIDGKIMRKK